MKLTQQQYIVAVGASAGGLEAIQEFFDHMPRTENLSFVIIQHLSPDFKSLLVELVGRHTHMKVVEAADGTPVQINHIYVIPNNKFLTIKKGKLVLAAKTLEKTPNNAIDIFLHSLANDKRDKAIAAILSGTGSDGTRGIASIKECGGMVMVQEPNTARFDGMPNSAINSGNSDVITSPAKMPEAILAYIKEPSLATLNKVELDEALLAKIFGMITKEAGQDFHYYKTPTILRRISRRVVMGNFKDAEDYVKHLEANPAEVKHLAKDFLIGVTRFFRDKDAFDVLSEKVLPNIISLKENGEMVKVWIPACSTGEEAYSVAIALEEAIGRSNKRVEVKIFATDLDAANLEVASAGIYPASIAQDVPADILEKYFVHKNKQYHINSRIRKKIVFAKHDIIKDPPFIKNDLVCCRNMLIYMNNILQDRVFSILHFSVTKSGYLFLGPSENPTFDKSSVQQISAKWKIYRKISEIKPRPYLTDGFRTLPKMPEDGVKSRRTKEAETRGQRDLWDDLRHTLTNDMGLLALYIDRQFDIRETIGNYELLLTLPKKMLSLNLMRMLPQDVAIALNKEIKAAWKTLEKGRVQGLTFVRNGETHVINVLINPQVPASEDYTLLVVTKGALPNGEKHATVITPSSTNSHNQEYIMSLESELSDVKNSLQVAVEDLETANEELQSSNEELLSSNEELQSSNEELQSLNEELYTLNTEHQLKIKELVELNDDLNNYFRSTDIAQIFLDADLNIRKFNPASASMINFIESDLGRPISHISNNIRYETLMKDIRQVQRTQEVVEKEVQLHEGRHLLMRIMPYMTRDERAEGIIITFVDITTITDLNNIVRGVFNSSGSAIFAFRAQRNKKGQITDFSIIAANDTAQKMFGTEGKEFEGGSLRELAPQLSTADLIEQYVNVVESGKSTQRDLFIESQNKWFDVTAVKMQDGFVGSFTDITDKKRADQRIRKSYSELNEARETLKALNAELEDKVKERTRELSFSEERFRLVARATNDTLWDWDLTSNAIWWSESFVKMFGYNQSFSRMDWLLNIHPDEREMVESNLYAVINENKNQWNCEYRFRKSDGEYAHVLDRGYVLHNEFGVPYRMLGSILDLTQLKNAEMELASNISQRQFLAESIPLMVWTADEQRKVDFVNRQFEFYTGIFYDDAMEDGWQQAIWKEDLPMLMDTWERAALMKADFHCEVRIVVSPADYRWNVLRAKARKDQKGAVVSWVITTTDVHEQKVMNELLEEKVEERTRQLRVINRELESSNNDLQLFASVASHDLQEPLRKIHMFSKMVKDKHNGELPTDTNQYLDKIMQSANRMKALVINILNFSKLSADQNDMAPVEIGLVIKEVMDDFEVIIREKNARIEVGKIPTISGNKLQIQQVFQNLISNALKFTAPGVAPVVQIEASRVNQLSFEAATDPQGRWCRITVKDNGIGFDEEYRNRIFGLFHRLNSKDKFEGTGIGLAITKKIVEKHGGIVTADSTEGSGAVFTIILPVNR